MGSIKTAALQAILLSTAVITSSAQSVSIIINYPLISQTVSDSLLVRVYVSSTYELSFVRASIDALGTNLIFTGSGYWSNVIETTSLSRGSYTLRINAEDIFGNAGQAQRVFKVDRPPALLVASPMNGTVGTLARPNLWLSITGTDDDPANMRVNVYTNGSLVVSSNRYIERSIAAFSGRLVIEAVDSSDQRTYSQRTIYLESSSNLVDALEAPGPMLDFSGSRRLYASTADPPQPITGQLTDVASGVTIQGPVLWSYYPTSGWVSARSAVIVYDTPFVPAYTVALHETNFVIVGYTDGLAPTEVLNGMTIIRDQLFDFSRSTNGCFPYMGPCASQTDCRSLAHNEIVFIEPNDANRGVFRSRPTDPDNVCSPRVITQVSARQASRPISDGTNVVFQSYYEIVANIKGTDEVLGVWTNTAPPQYLVNSGWIGFGKLGSVNQRQIWTRSPTGQLEQRTFFSVSSDLESLSADGAVTFRILDSGGSSGPAVGRYLSVPAALPVWVNSGQGRIKWEDETAYVIIGRSALRISLGTLALQSLGSQAVRLDLRSPRGFRYVIQESSDLSSWSAFTTITNATGTFSLTNSSSGSLTFYRAILKP
jgi:hypothetical protein